MSDNNEKISEGSRMDTRKAKMVVNKGGRGGTTFRATLPTAWVRSMGLSEELRDLELYFDGKQIIIKNNDGDLDESQR